MIPVFLADLASFNCVESDFKIILSFQRYLIFVFGNNFLEVERKARKRKFDKQPS